MHDRGQLTPCDGGEPAGINGAVAALGPGEVTAEVGEAQVIGGREAAQVGVGGLAAAGTDPDGRWGEAGWRSCSLVRYTCPEADDVVPGGRAGGDQTVGCVLVAPHEFLVELRMLLAREHIRHLPLTSGYEQMSLALAATEFGRRLAALPGELSKHGPRWLAAPRSLPRAGCSDGPPHWASWTAWRRWRWPTGPRTRRG